MHIRQVGDATYTEDFAKSIAKLQFSDLSSNTRHSAKRGLLDWLGCALVGSKHPTPALVIVGLDNVGLDKLAEVKFGESPEIVIAMINLRKEC